MRCYGGVRLLGSGPCLKNIERLDLNAMPMISAFMQTGLQVDLSHFAAMETALTRDMEELTETVKQITGYYCNLSSPDQKADLLFKKLGLKQARPKMTPTGYRESVEDEVLTAIQHDHPVVPLLLQFAELDKLRGTYVVPMPKLAVHTKFGEWRMYPNLTHTRVPSGRLACKEPNLLAMPTRTERGRDIRKGFITKPGWSYVSIDLSQIEMRVAAHRSQDANLMNIYHQKEDIYSDFATTAFKLRDERYRSESGKWVYPTVDKMNHRFPAKTCILASMYRVTAPGLLAQMPVICGKCGLPSGSHTCGKFIPEWTEDKCQSLINSFYQRYPGLLTMQRSDDATARRTAMVWDSFGRILHVTAVRSVHSWVVSEAFREAGNFPVQSDATGILKLSMAAIYDDLEYGNMLDVVHPLIIVHDEIIGECRDDVADEFGELSKFRMENAVQLLVPIKAEPVKAPTWGDIEK